MFTRILHDSFGLFLALALTVGFQNPYRISNDRGGVGASGTIGRGTGPGEHFVRVSPPAQPAPVWVYATPLTPARPAPAQAELVPAAAVSISISEPAIRLPALARVNPYSAYHRGWVRGYWNARLPDSSWRPTPGPGGMDATPGKGPSPVLGIGLGWGLPAWLIGPMAYSWGYFPYNNPFQRGGSPGGADRQRFDDYSRPINVLSPPPTEIIFYEAIVGFEAARDAFRREDFPRALRLTDEALRLMPEDPMLHQFRALSLFSLRRYEEAAATLHAVLAVVPGWDWLTVVSLYGNLETYTHQLRLLEEAAGETPRSAAASFVLAYHYLSTGFADEAVDQWGRVLSLLPSDALTAGLIRELRPSRPSNGDQAAGTPTTSGSMGTSAASAVARGKLEGTWTARPRADTTITLVLRPRGRITWKVSQPGRDREYTGFAIHEQRTLILSANEDNALVGTLLWQDEGCFTFKALAGRPGDAGLTFAKSL